MLVIFTTCNRLQNLYKKAQDLELGFLWIITSKKEEETELFMLMLFRSSIKSSASSMPTLKRTKSSVIPISFLLSSSGIDVPSLPNNLPVTLLHLKILRGKDFQEIQLHLHRDEIERNHSSKTTHLFLAIS
jgi:hypothetical protein